MSTSPSTSGNSKHIYIKYHFIRDHTATKSISTKWIPTADIDIDKKAFCQLAELIYTPYIAKLPGYYVNMKRKGAEIMRPYFSQAVTVITMCEALAHVLEVQGDPVQAEHEIEE
ncbi:hypothetical protein MPER_02211 [Moniliophthora perniciosa FA553]|nr:hypothetical protein MPER_02211 [Moniliophthora perniciosa FA553]